MTLYKHVRDIVERYSFITKTSFSKTIFKMYYMVGDKEKFKKLPYRATKFDLQNKIEKIKQEIDYYELKKIRDEKVKKIVNEELSKKPIIKI